jgi:hypothetical protein
MYTHGHPCPTSFFIKARSFFSFIQQHRMRSAVSSAIYIFLVTFQLTNFTQGAIPNLVKASRSTAGEITEASESAYYVGQVTSSAKELVYWTPPPTNPLVIEQLAEHQPKIFSSAAGASSSKSE